MPTRTDNDEVWVLSEFRRAAADEWFRAAEQAMGPADAERVASARRVQGRRNVRVETRPACAADCGRPWTAREWEDRHTTGNGPVHPACCEECPR